MTLHIGVLTAGGDSPGLNAAIRGIGKSATPLYKNEAEIKVTGFLDGFRGLMENRFIRLEGDILSNLLTKGGTILGTSRDKPHKMMVAGQPMDMTEVIHDNYKSHHLDALVCIGGGGTQKNAMRLAEKGMNIITLPKTIDNDVSGTDITFGFDTAMEIATSAIDRLHSTAHSHHRIIVVEIMGHNTGWLALGAGIASGADVILIPELPYKVELIAEAIKRRQQRGKNFSIVAIAEGALSKDDTKEYEQLKADLKKARKNNETEKIRKLEERKKEFNSYRKNNTMSLTRELEHLTGLESRLTILGYLQRGGTPSAFDRVLATQLGTACTDAIRKKQFGNMVALQNNRAVLVPLKEVVGKRKTVPLNHPWIESGLKVGVNFGYRHQ